MSSTRRPIALTAIFFFHAPTWVPEKSAADKTLIALPPLAVSRTIHSRTINNIHATNHFEDEMHSWMNCE